VYKQPEPQIHKPLFSSGLVYEQLPFIRGNTLPAGRQVLDRRYLSAAIRHITGSNGLLSRTRTASN
jgi:hypothetical protein